VPSTPGSRSIGRLHRYEYSVRRFLLEYVDKVDYVRHRVSLYGSVPVASGDGDDTPAKKLPFCIVSEITRQERYEERMRVGEAMKYQQSLTLLRQQQLPSIRAESPDRYAN